MIKLELEGCAWYGGCGGARAKVLVNTQRTEAKMEMWKKENDPQQRIMK